MSFKKIPDIAEISGRRFVIDHQLRAIAVLVIATTTPLFLLASCVTVGPAKIFRSALSKVKTETKIPILLPSELPSPIKEREIHFVDGHGESGKYDIALYYEKNAGDAGFAGYFAGEAKGTVAFKEKVKLEDGITGFFFGRSCGGSCSPSTIEWVENGILYTAQLQIEYNMRNWLSLNFPVWEFLTQKPALIHLRQRRLRRLRMLGTPRPTYWPKEPSARPNARNSVASTRLAYRVLQRTEAQRAQDLCQTPSGDEKSSPRRSNFEQTGSAII